jgi:hypothetical protein
MAYTTADADALRAAIASGASEVRFSDGRSTRFRSLADLRSALAEVLLDLDASAAEPRVTYCEFRRD